MVAHANIAIIGAGVIGLTSAVRLAEELPSASVTVIAQSFGKDTTSAGAAGLWEPYKLSDTPPELINKWGKETYEHLQDLLLSPWAASSGIYQMTAHQFWTKDMEDPIWKSIVPHFRHMSATELQSYNSVAGGVYKHGWAFTTLICEGAKYLTWLQTRLQQAGGQLLQKHVDSLQQVAQYDLVINCTGLGSAKLFGDSTMYPIQGHVIRVRAPWVKGIYFCNEQTYIIPNEETVVLGGTGYIGDWNSEANAEDRDSILKRCSRMLPSLAEADIVREWVGLRPGRPSVRLEKELCPCESAPTGFLPVVHNYGHGGAGLTLAWGCAGQVVSLATASLEEKAPHSRL